MAESMIQSERDCDEKSVKLIEAELDDKTQIINVQRKTETLASQPPIIWTPRFIVIFTLLLVIGLSVASLLTQGWLNHYYAREWVLLSYVALVSGCWISVIGLARSAWMRIGGIFGGLWVIFTSMSLILSLLSIDPHSTILTHLNAATNSSLLSAYICLSIDYTPFYRWDGWFFRFTPIAGGCTLAIIYLLTPAEMHSLNNLESMISIILLTLCILVWWMRFSCWKTQPGTTFLFGIVPTIWLLLTISGTASDTAFFFSQVTLLCLMLALLRLLQGGIKRSSVSSTKI